MNIGTCEVARRLDVDRSLVQRWVFIFKDYLSEFANPPKGSPRRFTVEDTKVLSYVFYYWEESPDLENIFCGLNCGYHNEEIFEELSMSVTKIFQDDLPENLDETWRHGRLFTGQEDPFTLADSFKLAGDKLVDIALSEDNVFDLFYPIAYNYRHSIELYLKSVLPESSFPKGDKTGHNLNVLLEKLNKFSIARHNTVVPDDFKNIIKEFHSIDENSETFRYAEKFKGEFWNDVTLLKKRMNWLAKSFSRINLANYI